MSRRSGLIVPVLAQIAFVVMGACSIASIIARVFQIELVGTALNIIQVYWNWSELFSVWLLEWWLRDWFGIDVPRWAMDAANFWVATAGMAVRGERQHYRSMEKIAAYRMSEDKPIWWIKRYATAALLGPISVFNRASIAIRQAIRWIGHTLRKKDDRSRELAWVYTRGTLEVLGAIFGVVILDLLFFSLNRYQALPPP